MSDPEPLFDDAEYLPALLLAIKPQFADRILEGKKRYELRKSLPRDRFRRVYLYVSGGGGVVGCFDAAAIKENSVDRLWNEVGEAAAPKDRFYRYFANRQTGSAIEVKDPVRFLEPLCPSELRKLEPQFIAPQSFLYVHPADPLYRELERRRVEAMSGPQVRLRPIKQGEREQYVDLITASISPRYDDITAEFARNNLRIHDQGVDRHGVFTETKEVLALVRGQELIGFTTLTYKLGHSLKTGPTLVFEHLRGRGLGLQARTAIEQYARARQLKKLYCTCPDNEVLVQHFIKAGYRIEGHLLAHYQPTRGEIVLGKVLEHAVEPLPLRKRTKGQTASVVASSELPKRAVIAAINREFRSTWLLPSHRFGERMMNAIARRNVTSFEEKPVRLLCLKRASRCVGVLVLVEKRGGAVKGLILTSTSHTVTMQRLIAAAEQQLKRIPKRKLYFVHPMNDPALLAILTQRGYRAEAVLEQPYRIGQDAMVLSTFL